MAVSELGGLQVRAAQVLLAALPGEQRARMQFPFEHEERYAWHFTPVPRRGVPLRDMNGEVRALAEALVLTGLSAAGAVTAAQIRSLEAVLMLTERERATASILAFGRNRRGETQGDLLMREGYEAIWRFVRDPELYFLTVFGEPSEQGPWGWRFEGHHLSLNVTWWDGQVATTPSFFGAHPAEVREGPRAGLRVLAEEEERARTLVQSLDARQRARAVLSAEAPDDILTFNHRRAEIDGSGGVTAEALSMWQRGRLRDLLAVYAGRMPTEVAAARMAAVDATPFEQLRFVWMGGLEPGEPHYYRVQSPSFVVEYDCTQDGANHQHTVWREITGDWGLDLLGTHLAAAHGG